jgi:Macrophage migration inhibitory factor (MIF)
MPFVELITNVSLTRAQTEELALSLSACAAETLQKPEFAFGINVRANEVLTFAGNQDPCMLLVLYAFLLSYHLCEDRTNREGHLLRMTN